MNIGVHDCLCQTQPWKPTHMRHQHPQFIRYKLTLILTISVVNVASKCLPYEPPRKAPSSAGERFPPVSELASRTGLPDPLVMKPED